MKTALFTDLDGTLIFSKNSLPTNLPITDCQIMETYSNGQHGYMETKTWNYLTDWSKENLFVPVTTRSTEQYLRLTEGFQHFDLPYVLTSNGGNLYHHGILDQSWNEATRVDLANELQYFNAVLTVIEKLIAPEWIRKIKKIDELFFCILVIERTWDSTLINKVNQQLQDFGWHAYFQHKKLYVLPIRLSKENAAVKLKERWHTENYQIKTSVALGDTTMDCLMLLQQDAHFYFGEKTAEFPALSVTPYSFQKIYTLLN